MPDTLTCPNCSAQVAYRDAVGDMQCPHCKAKLLVQQSTQTFVGLDQVPAEYRLQVQKALEMARAAGHAGEINKIEAIRFYRHATGAGLAEAKRIIEMAGSLHVGPSGGGRQPPPPMAAAGGGKGGLFLLVAGLVAAVSVVVGGIVARMASRPPISAAPPISIPNMPQIPSIPAGLLPSAAPQFATLQLEFGSQGTGPAHFDDARSVAVDNQGHVYVGEYSNGRVQVFDTSGKYLSEFSLGPRSYLQNLMADRKGMVYAVSSQHILIFTGATGAAQSEMENSVDGVTPKLYVDACLAPAGDVMYAISSVPGAEEVVKLDMTSGKITGSFDTKKAVGESLDFFRIVATNTGDLYLLDRDKGVFKFTTDGRYVNRFGGGKKSGASPLEMPPSQLFSPFNLAVDGQGHLYVSDAGSCIKVYDREGNYLATFGGHEVAFGIAIDDQDNIYASFRNKHTVRKYVINKR